MDPLQATYAAIVGVLFTVGRCMRLRGHRGRVTRAFMVAAGAGLVAPIVTYSLYLLLVPLPRAPPPPPVEIHATLADLPVLLMVGFITAIKNSGPSIGYKLGLELDPLLFGAISIPVAFLISFLWPLRIRSKMGGPPSTS